MASTRSLLFVYISVLLFLCLINFTPLSQYMVSPKQANSILLLNLAFYSSKRNNEDVFPAMGLTQNFNLKIQSPRPVLVSEQKMVVLTEKNFSKFITQNQHVMVVFYSSHYFWRKRLSPESSAAAMKRKGNLVVAKVDAEKEKLLAKKYKIGNYPTVCFFNYGFIEEFYVDQQIRIPAETGKSEKTKLTKCQDDEDQRNFDAPLKELQEPIRSYEKFTTLEDAPVEDEAPRRSDEKISWKVVYTQPGVENIYPVRTSGQSTKINLDDTTSDEEPFKQSSEEFAFEKDLTSSSEYRADQPDTKFHAPLKELQEPVRFHEKITILENENAPVEDVAPRRSDEKSPGKVALEHTHAGIDLSPYQPFTQSAEEFAIVKSHERLRETEKKNALNENHENGGMSMNVGEFMEDDKNSKGPTDYIVESSSTNLRWIPLDTENDAEDENFEELLLSV